jgi:hypothetical protein
MAVDITVAPYYDDYDPSKKYNKLLAVPGRVEQARDFTQMQTMIYDYLQRLSDTIFKNGSVISGMGFVMKTSTILVESGRVYLNGKIHMFTQQEIPITKIGLETVGVKAVDSIVTEVQDATLLDPTTSTGNLGQPGTHRIKTDVQLVLNDATASPILTFQDGNLTSETPKPQFDGLASMLAQRTYDESGNYRVRGLTLDAVPYDANNVNLIIEAGTAYVMGYQVIKPTPTKMLVPLSKTTRPVVGEPKTYKTGTTKYVLNNVPAHAISQLTAYVQVTNTVTRGATPNGIDNLVKTPVVDIQTITAGGTTYIRGTDYQLTTNGVDWSLGGAEPSAGSSYSVTYTYNKTMVQGTDYQLFSEIGDFGETKDSVQFLSGDKPYNNTTFWVNYDFYLARLDSVSMDKDGAVVFTAGQPDIPRNVSAPIITDPTLLPLGTIYLPPNSGGAVAKFSTVTRLDMSQLQRISQRVDDIEFNQAISALDRESMDGELPTDLKGIFSDSFRSTTRADLAHALFNVMYDLEVGKVMLPLSATTSRTPAVSTTNTIKQWRRLGTTPSTEVVAASQPYATTTMLVNPYLAFNAMGSMILTPQVYNWIEDSTINIENTVFKARNFWRWWAHTNQPWTYDKNADLMGATIVSGGVVGSTLYDWRPAYEGPNTYATATVVQTSKSTQIIKDSITYMKQITVQIYAKNLQPATDNLSLKFDGITCALTPVSGYSAGSAAGTVRANSSGEVKATFTVPANVKTGTREVILTNSGNNASTSFTSIGTKETTINTVTTTYTTLTAIDPLAQTFQFDNDTMLTSVGVYFAAKDATNNVKVQIRNVVNGYPGNVIFGEQILTPSQVSISADSSVETKISFDDPIPCTANLQYCMVFLTDSAVHSMYVCDLGQRDIKTGALVVKEPYLPGLLFSSSNGIAWTAHQSMNMKFNIYKAQFNLNATIDFVEQTSMNADRLLLLADAIIPTGCALTWQVSLDGGAYQPITPYSDLDLLTVASRVKLRVMMTATGDLSPILAMDSLVLTGWTTGTSGSYVGRNVELTQPITNVKQIFDAHIPSGCAVTAQFSYDDGTTWITPTQTSATPMSADYTRYICEATISAGANALNFRARLNITSNDPTLRPSAQRFANIMK